MSDIQKLFNDWGRQTPEKFLQKQWLLSKWDNIDGIEWSPEKINLMLGHIQEALQLDKTDIIADLGCGGGWIGRSLCDQVRLMLGFDFSLNMLLKAKSCCAKSEFVCADIVSLPLADESINKIICYFVFINIVDDDQVAKAIYEIYRTLKRGGIALIGQLPDECGSAAFDSAKKKYLEYCQKTFQLGLDYRDCQRIPQKIFSKDQIAALLKEKNIRYMFRPSFNPFYREGESPDVTWRFDILLQKD